MKKTLYFLLIFVLCLVSGCGQKAELSGQCVISVDCVTALDHADEMSDTLAAVLPEDGMILPAQTVSFYEGESAFDLLQRVCRENKIPLEFTKTPVYDSAYIEGIGNLYEFDLGPGSGWHYCVNGVYPAYSGSEYTLCDGDVLQYRYTCDLGADIGCGVAE